jgi:hypothetical protein
MLKTIGAISDARARLRDRGGGGSGDGAGSGMSASAIVDGSDMYGIRKQSSQSLL